MLAKLSYLGRLYELGPDSGKKINLLLFCCCFYFKWPCNELATPPGGGPALACWGPSPWPGVFKCSLNAAAGTQLHHWRQDSAKAGRLLPPPKISSCVKDLCLQHASFPPTLLVFFPNQIVSELKAYLWKRPYFQGQMEHSTNGESTHSFLSFLNQRFDGLYLFDFAVCHTLTSPLFLFIHSSRSGAA